MHSTNLYADTFIFRFHFVKWDVRHLAHIQPNDQHTSTHITDANSIFRHSMRFSRSLVLFPSITKMILWTR